MALVLLNRIISNDICWRMVMMNWLQLNSFRAPVMIAVRHFPCKSNRCIHFKHQGSSKRAFHLLVKRAFHISRQDEYAKDSEISVLVLRQFHNNPFFAISFLGLSSWRNMRKHMKSKLKRLVNQVQRKKSHKIQANEKKPTRKIINVNIVNVHSQHNRC